MSGMWMETHRGGRFYPGWPEHLVPDIKDIAHALSNICRFGGHCARFYSVAEHSIHVARLLPPELRLQGLMHDAAEYVMGDMPTPLKRALHDYRVLEAKVWAVIADTFGLPLNLDSQVHRADLSMLALEKRDLHPNASEWPILDGVVIPNEPLWLLPPDCAEAAFLDMYRELAEGCAR